LAKFFIFILFIILFSLYYALVNIDDLPLPIGRVVWLWKWCNIHTFCKSLRFPLFGKELSKRKNSLSEFE